MCGIAGILGDLPDKAAILDRMLDAIAYRGPDSRGVDAERGIGMVRLAIIDPDGGDQPIYSEDGNIAVVFNGEVYNYVELRRDLRDAGHHFRTDSDTEVMVHGWEEWGPIGLLDAIRADFGVCIHDKRTGRAMLARDPLGLKPLYIYCGPSFVAFASEIKALLQIPGVKRDVNIRALNHYLRYKFVPAPDTMIESIEKVLPGHCLEIDGGRVVRDVQYWDIPLDDPAPVSETDAVDGLEEALRRAVEIRLRADVPVGAMLSGGIDSSLVAAMASRIYDRAPIDTFTADCPLVGADDADYARTVASAWPMRYHSVRFGVDDFIDALPFVAWVLDEPMGDTACASTLWLARTARDTVGVLLSGIGADELYSGLGRNKRGATHDPRDYGVEFEVFPESQKRELLGAWKHVDSSDVVRRYVRQCSDADNAILAISCKTYLVDQFTHLTDRMTMGVPVEARAPYLDRDVVEHAFSLPGTLKNKSQGKHILKRLCERYFPQEFVYRPKRGFGVAREKLIESRRMRLLLERLVLSDRAQGRGWFEPWAVARVFAAGHQGMGMEFERLWALVMLEIWARIYLDGEQWQTVLDGVW